MKGRIEAALDKRKAYHDPFRGKYGYSWDYVMVFKVYNHDEAQTPFQQKYSLKMVLNRLADAGLETKLFYSVQVSLYPPPPLLILTAKVFF